MGALKATLSQPRVATAWVAVLVFGLFAIVILWLHDAAAVGTGALGMSVWTESGPTEARA